MAWIPVADKTLMQKLESGFIKIADIILDIPPEDIKSIGLMSGRTGIALFFYYCYDYTGNNKYSEYADRLLSSVFDEVNLGRTYYSFAAGLAGIGWSVCHLKKNKFIDIDEDPFTVIEDFLNRIMIEEIRQGNFDYLHGALGVGLYFLQSPNPKRANFLEQLLDELWKIAIRDGNRIFWRSAEKYNSENKGYNLGLSHGLASIILFLSKLYSNSINRDKSHELISGSVKFLLDNKQDIGNTLSYFPNWVKEGTTPQNSRLAWCYGDLGIGISLYYASEAISDEKLNQTSLEILMHCSGRRNLKENGVIDAGICHGTAGIAHIFNRLDNITSIREFDEARNYWFEKTLEMIENFSDNTGYLSDDTDTNKNNREKYGLLEGVAGIGLSMLAAVSDKEPGWDASLLLS